MKYFIIVSLLVTAFITGCKRSDFLNAKPNQSLVVPKTLDDMQAILDNDYYMNGVNGTGPVPALGEIGADNYWTRDENIPSMTPLQLRMYTWQKSVFQGEQIESWNYTYNSIYQANLVIEGLSKLQPDTSRQAAYNNVLGSALFFRAHGFYQLAQVFAPQYVEATANQQLGIPLRLTADVNEKITRATLKETYDKILADLEQAAPLLAATSPYKTRPTKAAVYGLLARVYQTMQKYDKALQYADLALQINNQLLDYNDASQFNLASTFMMPDFKINPEVIFQANLYTGGEGSLVALGSVLNNIDTALYNSYDTTDWRRTYFFSQIPVGPITYTLFTGTYYGNFAFPFAGIATDELYLIRAESYARLGDTTKALKDLNSLLAKRYKTASFTPVTATSAANALAEILTERRKELIYRGLRWTDLRRLNAEGANITLTRKVNGTIYTLPPNDLRWVYPIPDPVISFNPGMQQNPR